MRHIALSSLAFLILPHFYKLSHKRQYIFGGGVTEHKIYVFSSLQLSPYIFLIIRRIRGSHLPRGPRRRSAAARLLILWVRIPPGAWMFVCCECCVLSGRGLWDELITSPEESYRLWCVVVCDLETSLMKRPWPTGGCPAKNKQKTNGITVTVWATNVGRGR